MRYAQVNWDKIENMKNYVEKKRVIHGDKKYFAFLVKHYQEIAKIKKYIRENGNTYIITMK